MASTSVYHAIDSVLCLFVFFPSMVLYWRGIWDLWGYYLDENVWALFGTGCISLLGYVIQPALHRVLLPLRSTNYLLYAILLRIYLFCFAAFLMCFWRGVWDVPDYYLGKDLLNNLIMYLICCPILFLCRAGRTAIFPPMFAVNDLSKHTLTPSTRFGAQPYSSRYIFDALFSHFLLFVAILTWRSMWNIIVDFMFEDHFKTNIYCLCIGYSAVCIVYILEEPLGKITLLADKKGFWWKLAWEDSLYYVIKWCLGFLWIGAWRLVEDYVFPPIPNGAWVCLVIGACLLFGTQQFGFVSTCGCVVDAADEGRGAVLQSYFLRYHLLVKKEKMTTVITETDENGLTNAAYVIDTPEESSDPIKADLNNNGQIQIDSNDQDYITVHF